MSTYQAHVGVQPTEAHACGTVTGSASTDVARTAEDGPRRSRMAGTPIVISSFFSNTAQRLVTNSWVHVIALYAGSRIYSTALMAGVLAIGRSARLPFPGTRGKLNFFTLSGSWDGWFYRTIAEHGYPTTLPVDPHGHVLPNPWAFLPVYPFLERLLVGATGATTFQAGTAISITAGAVAALALHQLLRPWIGHARARAAVALFCFGPLAFLLQVAYAESLFLALTFIAIIAAQNQRYLTFTLIVAAAAFTRPGAIALPAALALHLIAAWWFRKRPPQKLAQAVAALAISTAASSAWPVVATLVTHRASAYLDTELSWWTGWVGRPSFVPFTPWFLITSRWLGPGGVIAAVLITATLGWWILKASPRQLSPQIRSYSAMYATYLIAVFLPQFSLPRLLLPLAPLLGAAAFTGTAPRQRRWIAGAAALQPVFVVLLWFLSYP